ncbi:MAG TPA: HDOD domain-containing protein [Opitutaceae bacterium]|nr:HDOD domain-containing protein [Opitutaceae bacterium]HOY54977.1 HDOD domain-containing protein [Opitutaceae bacterium]HPG17648.1 HDOD domain-containing protein [Opitutaceae bacterium]HPN99715.1 HDOD domain-containing protein [Opitutaceae bacterium]
MQDVLGVAQRLPSTSHVFAQVNRLLDDPNTDLDAISELVKMDPVLSFRVLQLANSAIYGFRTACSDLSEALARLGFTEINRLVGLIATKNLCTSFLSVYGLSSEVFWDDSMRSALACEWLSQRHAYGDGRTAYTAGLLRSMGKVVMQRILVDRPVSWRSYVDASGGLPLLAWETEMFGLTNTEAAGVLMEKWKLPAELVHAVKTHCESEGAAPLPHLLRLGASVAAQLDAALPGEAVYWAEHDAIRDHLEIDDELLQACASEVEIGFQRVKHALKG